MRNEFALLLVLVLAMVVGGSPTAGAEQRPAIIIISLVDDLGFSDIQPNGPWSPTPHMGELARQGVVLRHMHAYMYCSPTRRALLSGRLPLGINVNQAPACSNYLPLQLTLLSEKLRRSPANFTTHYVGKGQCVRFACGDAYGAAPISHDGCMLCDSLGYQTTDHLPVRRGFDTHLGFIQGDQNYAHGLQVMCDVPNLANLPDGSWMGHWPPRRPPDVCNLDFWRQNGTAPKEVLDGQHYSTLTYAAETVQLIEAKEAERPMFIYLAWQAVHGPWSKPPDDAGLLKPSDPHYNNYCTPHPAPLPDPKPNGLGRTQTMRCQFGSMLKVLDTAMENITNALTRQGLWDQALMFVASDNGGVGPGNNWPLRGQKHTPWQGGTRISAFVTGGFVPPRVRGCVFDVTIHVADLYATLINRAGGVVEDTVTLAGKPRAIDSLDFWPLLLTHSVLRQPSDAAQPPPASLPLLREYLPTTESSIIWRGRWKLITSAGLGGSYWRPPNGVGPNNTMVMNRSAWPCVNNATASACLICSAKKPCLFDLWNDESENKNVALQHADLVAQLSQQLRSYETYVDGKMTIQELENYDCVEPTGHIVPEYWGNFSGPCCKPKSSLHSGLDPSLREEQKDVGLAD